MSTDRSSRAGLGLVLAVTSAASFGTSGSFARSLTESGWTPAAAVAARIGAAALLLVVPAAFALRGRWRLLQRNAALVSAYGVIAVGGAQVGFFNAVQTLPVGVALLLEYLGTVLVVLWMWLRHGHRPRRLTVAGSAVAIAGLVLLLDLTGETSLDAVGVLWALGAAVGLAWYYVVSSKTDNDLPPLAIAGAGMVVGTVTLFALGAVGVLPMRATFGDVDFAGQRTSWLVPVVGLSLLAGAIAYVAGIEGARLLGAKLASFVGLTEVIFGVLFAWMLLGELPTAIQLGGGVLIIAGVSLVRVDEMRLPDPVVEPHPVPVDAH